MDNHQVALVTDGMDSVGTAICRRLHAAGIKVATTYSPAWPRAQAWLDAQRNDGFHFLAFKLDPGDHADCEWMMQKLLADTGRLDVLVNKTATNLANNVTNSAANKAMGRARRGARAVPADDWQGLLRARLDSMFNVSKQALGPMTAQRWGRIVNITPSNAPHGTAGLAGHAAAVAGVHGFTRALALEVARHGITVNSVSPGCLRSAPLPAAQEEPGAGIVAQIPVGRLGRPDELAALVAYLASDEAAFLTGADIPINGGQYLSW